jgi:CDP-diacylglycerol--serine O-phosphatidyltransferase
MEFDSLSDLLTFGIAPSLLVYSFALWPYRKVGWLAAFLFVICGALRLARYNAAVSKGTGKYFAGLPIPGAAAAVASMIIFYFDYWEELSGFFKYRAVFSVIVVYCLAFLMISTVKFRSFKEFNLQRKKPFTFLVALILGILIVLITPQVSLLLIFWGYVLSGGIEALYHFVTKNFKTAELKEERAFKRLRKKEGTFKDGFHSEYGCDRSDWDG